MSEPMKLGCVCGFLADNPDAFVTHILMTGHVLSADARGDLTDGGGLAGLIRGLQEVQEHPERGVPVDLDDEDTPEEVRAAFARFGARPVSMLEAHTEVVPPGDEERTIDELFTRARYETLQPNELLAYVCTGGPYTCGLVLYQREPRGELRLYRGAELEPCVRRELGMPEIAMFRAGRNDLFEPLLDALVQEAEAQT